MAGGGVSNNREWDWTLRVLGRDLGRWLLLCQDGWADGGDSPR